MAEEKGHDDGYVTEGEEKEEKDEEKKKAKKDKEKSKEKDGDKKKDKKKSKEEKKQKLSEKYGGGQDLDKLKKKLEKIDGKIEMLQEDKAEILRLIKEAEEKQANAPKEDEPTVVEA